MKVSEELDQLHEQFPACGTVAYADLATKMVLVANSQSPLDRHGLDQLCAQAVQMLGSAPPLLGKAPAGYALISEPESLRLFVCMPGQIMDALLCQADRDVDLAALQAEAQACLARIMSDEA